MTLCGLVGPLLRFEFQALDIDFRWVKANRDSACLMVPCVRNTVSLLNHLYPYLLVPKPVSKRLGNLFQRNLTGHGA